MKSTFTFFLLLICTLSFAQTRRIAHRAHSGAKHARFDDNDGSYGRVAPRKVKVHLESGRDTMVYEWDSIASPNYHYWELDTTAQINIRPIDPQPKQYIREMGEITHRLTVKP